MDPLWLAMSRYRRGKLDSAITICDDILSQRPGDQAAWSVKCRSVIKQNYLDDIEMNQESVAEMLLGIYILLFLILLSNYLFQFL